MKKKSQKISVKQRSVSPKKQMTPSKNNKATTKKNTSKSISIKLNKQVKFASPNKSTPVKNTPSVKRVTVNKLTSSKKETTVGKGSVSEKKTPSVVSDNFGFIGLLFLFVAFSLYGIISFFLSTNNYINHLTASVVDTNPQSQVIDSSECVDCEIPSLEGASLETTAPIREIFLDVNSNDRNAEAIEYLYKAGLISGYDDGTFRPENTLNRAELLTVLTNAVNADFSINGPYDNCFPDVKNEWYAVYVCYAKANNWVSGYENGKFMAGDLVTRSATLKMVLNAFGFQISVDEAKELPFDDVSVEDWFYPYVVIGSDLNLIKQSTSYFPQRAITRGEFIQLVFDVMNVTNAILD